LWEFSNEIHCDGFKGLCIVVKAATSLDSMTCTKTLYWWQVNKQVVESLVVLETTQSVLGNKEMVCEGFDNGCIGNQVKLRA